MKKRRIGFICLQLILLLGNMIIVPPHTMAVGKAEKKVEAVYKFINEKTDIHSKLGMMQDAVIEPGNIADEHDKESAMVKAGYTIYSYQITPSEEYSYCFKNNILKSIMYIRNEYHLNELKKQLQLGEPDKKVSKKEIKIDDKECLINSAALYDCGEKKIVIFEKNNEKQKQDNLTFLLIVDSITYEKDMSPVKSIFT